MISIALGAIFASNIQPQAQNQLFEKIADLNAPVLNDQEIFPYLKDGRAPIGSFVPSDSEYGKVGRYFLYKEQPAAQLKPNAPKLKVALCVFERVFLDPTQCASIESRDKQRILLAMNRARTMFINLHQGELDIDFVPKFYTEPVLQAGEMNSLVEYEFNDSVFDTEDNEERGPFVAIIKLSAVKAQDFASAFEVGANRPDAKLEHYFLSEILKGIDQTAHRRYGTELQPNLGAVLNVVSATNGAKIIDPRTTAPNDQIESVLQAGGMILSPATLNRQFDFVLSDRSPVTGLDKFEGTLRYYEQSVTRSGRFLVPVTESFLAKKSAKLIEFEVKPNTFNNVRISFSDGTGYSFGPNSADFELKQGEWKKITVPVPSNAQFIQIGAQDEGSMRLRTELVVYQFKNFTIKDGEVTVPKSQSWVIPPTEKLASSMEQATSLFEQRRLIQGIRTLKEDLRLNSAFKKALLDYTNSIDPFVAYWSAEAYGRLCFDPASAEDRALAETFLKTPPNEYARAAGLYWVAKHPELSNFEGISPNAVRVSWRTRLAAVKALAAQESGSSKSKPAARQMLFASTMQETAWIRMEALSSLKWSDPEERKRLEYASVNEPCEKVRLAVFNQIVTAAGLLTPEVSSAVLADDSATYRMRVAESLVGSTVGGARDLLRRMVVDIDPRVRSAALRSLLGFSDANNGEFQNLFADRSIVVQIALVESALNGKLKLPDEVRKNLVNSLSPTVRKLVGQLK
jgi:hypothetical protein